MNSKCIRCQKETANADGRYCRGCKDELQAKYRENDMPWDAREVKSEEQLIKHLQGKRP